MADGSDTKAELIERSPLLGAADPETRHKLASTLAPTFKWRSVDSGQPLFADAEMGLAVVEEGAVRVYALKDPTRLVDLRGPNEVVGEESLGGFKRKLVAATDVRMLWSPASGVVATEGTDESLRKALHAYLILAGVDAAEEERVRLLATTVEERLAAFLLGAAKQWGRELEEGDGIRIGPPLKRTEIAQVVGARRSTVSETLAAWGREGLLASDGRRIVVLDRGKLEAIAADAVGGRSQAGRSASNAG